MRILFAKSNWEVPELSLGDFLVRTAAAGFDATEIYLPARPESPAEICARHAGLNLALIAQIATTGDTLEDHRKSLAANFRNACRTNPLFVNCHTGRDIFSLKDNLDLFELGQRLSEDLGVGLVHELHRGRALFSGPETKRYLEIMPHLRLTADFSHWFCVHESDLKDQPQNTAAAVRAATHIHARVGFREGPQVGDPSSPANKPWLDLHLALWSEIVAQRQKEGSPYLTITPEFGPAPYMPIYSADDLTVADPWETNVWMRNYLVDRIGRAV
jgi:sugar phosphate isomerase/epimerase